jgi:hypothetical protein
VQSKLKGSSMTTKRITVPQKDIFLHDMLFDIYMANQEDDLSYYELFHRDIEKDFEMIRVDTNLLFIHDSTLHTFTQFENEKIYYRDLYVERNVYFLHHLAYRILDELSKYYEPRKRYDSDGYKHTNIVKNKSSFKWIQEYYYNTMDVIAQELHDLFFMKKMTASKILSDKKSLDEIIKKAL